MLLINDKYIPLLWDKHRFLVLYGGAGSGKSVFAAQKIVSRCENEHGHKFYCFRKVGSTVRDSVWAELKDVIYGLTADRDSAPEWTIHEHAKILKHAGGSEIHCTGLDDVNKMKSVKGVTGMWLDEADQFVESDIDQLNIRIRGVKRHYVQYIITFNPVDEEHWLKRKFIDGNRSDTLFAHSTYRDNAFLDKEDVEVLESYKETNPYYYSVYCLGEWGILDKSGKFLYSFDSKYHVGACEIDGRDPLRISFDFNIDPFAALIYQRSGDVFSAIEEIRLDNSDIFQMCDHIKASYPQSKYFYVVTGDRTGYNQTGVVRGKTSYWKIIKTELSLGTNQMRLRSKNLDLLESRILCNAALMHKDILIDPKCVTLIEDCKYSRVDDSGVLVKDRSKNKNDFLDTLRYALDAEYPELTRLPKKTA